MQGEEATTGAYRACSVGNQCSGGVDEAPDKTARLVANDTLRRCTSNDNAADRKAKRLWMTDVPRRPWKPGLKHQKTDESSHRDFQVA